jgi:hypothetical protein
MGINLSNKCRKIQAKPGVKNIYTGQEEKRGMRA